MTFLISLIFINDIKLKIMYKCVCGKEYSDDSKKSYLSHCSKCKEYSNIRKEKINKLLPKELLQEWFEIKLLSANQLAKELNVEHINAYQIIKQAKIFGIKTFTVQESCKLPSVIKKREETNIKNSGCRHNFCKNAPSRIKWEQEMLENEGITNVFQRKNVVLKLRKTLFNKYGAEHPMFIEEFVDKMIKTKRDTNSFGTFMGGATSKIHLLVCDWLTEYNIKFEMEFHIPKTTSENNMSGWYSYDIIILETNKLIEINGDYWHANPRLYKENDIKKVHGGFIVVKEQWEKDKLKTKHANDHGYEVLTLWEYDIVNNQKEVKDKILKYVNEQN
jgi:very-short-patch-repair endonuclease